MIDNDVLLFSATNEETPYEQLLHYWASRMQGFSPYKMPTLDRGITWTLKCQSEQHLFSTQNITILSKEKVMRINKMII